MINIYTISGYNEVGKNMTLAEVKNNAFVFDAGLYLPPVIELESQEGVDEKKLREIDAIPDDLILDKLGLRSKVRALTATHAHLDHIGALPFMAHRYKAPILSTPFSIEVLKSLIRDKQESKVRMQSKALSSKARMKRTSKTTFKNPLIKIMPNTSYKIAGHEIEFIHVTHSTLQTAMIALHTDNGIVMYSNDFKLDQHPMLGKKPNYKRLKQIGKEGVKALIVESLYASSERKTPSERIAYDLLDDVMLGTDNENAAIVVTTFSSHIARLNSIVKIAKKLGRKVLFFGRSLRRYVKAAEAIELAPFSNDIKLLSYKNEVEKGFKKVAKNKTDYVVVCTGHQGEPGSILERLAKGKFKFKLGANDHVIFSSKIIPSPINQANREQLEKKLKQKKVRIFSNVHISGHAGREDLRDFIKMVNPENIIPAHGELQKRTSLAELATELGYKLGYNVYLTENGRKISLR